MVSASIPCTKEPLGLRQSDGKWPDGLSLVPWELETTDLGRDSHLSGWVKAKTKQTEVTSALCQHWDLPTQC